MGPMNFLFVHLNQFENYLPNIRVFISQKTCENHYLVFMYGITSFF